MSSTSRCMIHVVVDMYLYGWIICCFCIKREYGAAYDVLDIHMFGAWWFILLLIRKESVLKTWGWGAKKCVMLMVLYWKILYPCCCFMSWCSTITARLHYMYWSLCYKWCCFCLLIYCSGFMLMILYASNCWASLMFSTFILRMYMLLLWHITMLLLSIEFVANAHVEHGGGY